MTTTANDNATEFDYDLDDLTDGEAMTLFFDLMDSRGINISTAFLQNQETGYVDKQVMIISCGDAQVHSEPVDLEQAFIVAPTPSEVN